MNEPVPPLDLMWFIQDWRCCRSMSKNPATVYAIAAPGFAAGLASGVRP